MAKVKAIHTISRNLDDGQTTQELPPGTVFEADGQELEDLRAAGAVEDAADAPLSDLSAAGRSDAGLTPPATSTIIPGAVPADDVAAETPPAEEKPAG
jgi:hypothetical protein